MWTRAELKTRAKKAFKRNYWICVLAALILAALCDGAFSRPSSGNQNQDQNAEGAVVTVGGMTLDDPELQAKLERILEERKKSVPGPVRYMLTNAFSGALPPKNGPSGLLVGILGAAFAFPALLLTILVTNVLEIGGCRFFLKNTHEQAGIGELAFGFENNYGNAVVTQFMRGLKTILWTLLLVIPGIVKSYEYMMIPYLLADDPSLTRQQAFEYSRRMMDGNKMKAFVLDLSFILWSILGGLTFGLVNIFWTFPYRYATRAELYLTLRDETFR
ncbi:MAG: DUF975 family protein [Lachnospiraceae bacterium]|nr:DUF975 family protein [Lachnospiraceae bacterium]